MREEDVLSNYQDLWLFFVVHATIVIVSVHHIAGNGSSRHTEHP
jgi:hypothetical protein